MLSIIRKKVRNRDIFHWNHVSDNLNSSEIHELKSYYIVLDRKVWVYNKASKKYKRIKLFGNIFTILTASGGIIAVIVTKGLGLIAISTIAMIIKSWMEQNNIELKIIVCEYAYKSYSSIMADIKASLRSGLFDRESIINQMKFCDEFVADNCPVVDKLYKDYDNSFSIPSIE